MKGTYRQEILDVNKIEISAQKGDGGLRVGKK